MLSDGPDILTKLVNVDDSGPFNCTLFTCRGWCCCFLLSSVLLQWLSSCIYMSMIIVATGFVLVITHNYVVSIKKY